MKNTVLLLIALCLAGLLLNACAGKRIAQPDRITIENGIEVYHYTVTAKRAK